MKKLIVILLILIPITLNAYYYQYPDGTIAVYDFEDYGVDATGHGYNGTVNGGITSTAKVKHGSYSFTASGSYNNNIILPVSLTQKLSTIEKFSIQWWTYSGIGALETFIAFNDINAFNIGYMWIGKWNNFSNYCMSYRFGNQSNENQRTRYIGEWIHTSFEYDGSKTKLLLYKNGTLTYGYPDNAGIISPFITHNNISIRIGSPPMNERALFGYMDNLIFYEGLANGVELLPIGISETKYFTPEEIIYFDKSKIIYQ